MKNNLWENKSIVITGTSSGIGLALLTEISKVECTIFALDRAPGIFSQDTKAKIIQIKCDISDEKQTIKAAEEILSRTDRVDYLFNNAGITAHGRFDETELSVYRKTFEVNFFGPVHLTKLLVESIKKAKGCVIITSTVSALYGIPGRAPYSSSKSALGAVIETLRIELSEFGVRAIIFCAPYAKTNLRTSGLTAKGETLNEAQYSGKLLTPEEVAKEIVKATENPNSKLVTISSSGLFVKILRLFAPGFLEKYLFKKLYNDFHH
jgi:NAD(P)-dependent dehydrogenase (short-subunit alcohol dehydrogenase family)